MKDFPFPMFCLTGHKQGNRQQNPKKKSTEIKKKKIFQLKKKERIVLILCM